MKLMQNVSVAVARNSARTVPLLPDHADAGADVVDEARRGGGERDPFAPVDPREERRRNDERHGVDGDRDGRGQPRDQRAAERRAGDLGDRVDRFPLAVGVEQALPPDEVGDEHVVGQVVQHGRDAGDDGDRVEQRQREAAREGRERNRQQRHRAHEVGADHQRPPATAVDEAAAEPREHRAGKRQRDGEKAEIVRAGPGGDDRRHRQRGARDPRADRRDALRAPQQQEIPVVPQAPARPPARRAAPGASANTPPSRFPARASP